MEGYKFSSVDHEANRYNSRIVETLEIKGKEQRLIEISDKGITQKFVIVAFYWNFPSKHYFFTASSDKNTL